MNCPTADKLSQFVDELLPKQEMAEIEAHVHSCTSCEKVVNAFQEEQRFVEETLQTPTLPENFTDLVLDQLEPYSKSKKQRKAVWKHAALTAAGVVLAVGIGATVNPAFAQFIGGLFSTDQVDEGLNIAAEAGLTKRVDLQVEDQGLTFVVEDVIADSSRVSLSYKVLNKNGKPQDTYLKNMNESENSITAIDQDGNLLNRLSTGWQEGSDYGFVGFSLGGHDELEKLTIAFDLVELNGVQGKWQLEVPVDLQENRKLTKSIDLNEVSASHHGVIVDLKNLQIAPSSSEMVYETSFAPEEFELAEEARKQFETEFGANKMDSLVYGVDTQIAYHIENADGKTIYSTYNPIDSDSNGMLGSSGEEGDKIGQTKWMDSFIPSQENNLTFVLDGVYKKELANLSLTIQPKNIKKQPVSVEYKGNHLAITSVKKNHDFSLQKSLNPIKKDTSVVIEMKGGRDTLSSDLGSWMVVDDKGNVYPGNPSGSVLNKKDKNGRFITTIELELDDLEEVPEQLTLHLVSSIHYYPVEKQWRVPLIGEN